MTDIKDKAKKVFEGMRETLVQEDNPNSPHKVFARMNQNMLGDAPETAFREKPDAATPHPVITPSDKKRKQMFSEEAFEEIIWGKE